MSYLHYLYLFSNSCVKQDRLCYACVLYFVLVCIASFSELSIFIAPSVLLDVVADALFQGTHFRSYPLPSILLVTIQSNMYPLAHSNTRTPKLSNQNRVIRRLSVLICEIVIQ